LRILQDVAISRLSANLVKTSKSFIWLLRLKAFSRLNSQDYSRDFIQFLETFCNYFTGDSTQMFSCSWIFCISRP
jgi:hypothetical protein